MYSFPIACKIWVLPNPTDPVIKSGEINEAFTTFLPAIIVALLKSPQIKLLKVYSLFRPIMLPWLLKSILLSNILFSFSEITLNSKFVLSILLGLFYL